MAGGRGWVMAAGLALAGLVLAGVAAVPARAAPAGYPVTGIDVSAYQGQVDWASVAAGGASFAYVRAGEQAGIADGYFAANYQAAKANGLYVGAYHRARPDLSSGTAQADFFIDHAQYIADGQTLPPMLDIEWPRANWAGLDACYNMTPAQMSAWIGDFVREVAARTGQRAMIYTHANWWNPCTGNNPAFGSYPLFVPGYTASPLLPAGWARWTFWQYSSSGALPGDQDVFSGDQAALTRLAGPWEQFKLILNPDGSISLLASANGRYVTAEQAGSSPLIADRTATGPWQTFYRTTG